MEFYTGENVAMPDNPKMIPDQVLEPTMHFVVQWILGITAYAAIFGNIKKIPWWVQALLLGVFSWTIRMDVIDLIGSDTVQILDFDRVFRMSLLEGSIFADVQGINFYRAFPNWALYVKLIHCLNVHFGAVPLTGIMWNVIASTASVVMVYLIVYLASGKNVLAILSALLF
ncbi:MAG: hypothetical protein J6S45_00780, partial [Firmicutes bacterium]|nr:hypothetical protein [Bacillota bacterium]